MNIEWMKKVSASSAQEFVEHVAKALTELNDREGHCWVCNKTTNFWIIVMPDPDDPTMSLGEIEAPPGKSGVRIAFAPVCPEHDADSKEVRRQVIHKLRTLRSTITN